ncbi:MAG: metal-dependent hydrolase [Acidimicrobiales bacterium]
MSQARNERQVPTRRISFEESLAGLPRHYADGGDLVGSHLLAALSGLFPDGEDFFVRSVRRFRNQVTDPVLKKQVNGFIGQEAMHGREHRAFNDRLAELGYPVRLVEKATKKGLAVRERLLSDKSNLAATAALEHFTATLAELVLTDESVRVHMGDPAVRDLFVWHALEESEHKAVAFDVYKAVGGTERTRVVTMKFLRFGFIAGLFAWVSVSVLTDPATYRPGRLLPSLRRMARSPLVSRDLYRRLKDYDRTNFHPEDRDTTALVEQWRTELFGPEGTLIDKLVTSAA